MATLTPEQFAALRTALDTLASLPDGVELRAYITAGGVGQTDPPGEDFMLSLRVERGVTQPPVVTPPTPTTMTMYVVSTNGVSVRSIFGVPAAGAPDTKLGSLPFGASVIVEQVYTATATGYLWRKIASTNPVFPGAYVAEKSSDGATALLSASRP